ncbi:radical SAM protein [Paenibacillus sp. P26]|nr:radical SAM protein [Paenibacillus sp. P26]
MASRTTYTPMKAKTLLNPVKVPSMPFDWSINPYRGRQHGCSFCYARSTHAFLGMETDDTFQHQIMYKENAKMALQKQLEAMKSRRRGKPVHQVAIGTATDPYQPIEAKAGLTRDCLEVLAEHQLPVSITTRSPLILRDIPPLKRFKQCSVNISLNTLDQVVWRRFEPSTPSPAKRLEAIKELSAEGIDVTVFMAPILPMLTDSASGMEAVVAGAAEAGARRVMGSVLRLNTNAVKSWYFQTLGTHYPHLTASYAGMYAGGAYAPEEYRTQVRERLHGLLKAYGLPVYDPYRPRTEAPQAPIVAPEEQPVQLAFSFE